MSNGQDLPEFVRVAPPPVSDAYRVYRSDCSLADRILMFDRYTIADPAGMFIGIAATRWGARRIVRSHRRYRHSVWWLQPVVDEIRPGGQRHREARSA